jgi:hypothetical protein
VRRRLDLSRPLALFDKTGQRFIPLRRLPALETNDGMFYFLATMGSGLKIIRCDPFGDIDGPLSAYVANVRL